MKTVIFGSRSFAKYPNKYAKKYQKNPVILIADHDKYEAEYLQLVDLINTFQVLYGGITEVVSGSADGVDQAGERWANENGVKIKTFKPQWKKDGKLDKGAGFKRNIDMAEYCDMGIGVIVDNSNGSSQMKREMNNRKKELLIKEVNNV